MWDGSIGSAVKETLKGVSSAEEIVFGTEVVFKKLGTLPCLHKDSPNFSVYSQQLSELDGSGFMGFGISVDTYDVKSYMFWRHISFL